MSDGMLGILIPAALAAAGGIWRLWKDQREAQQLAITEAENRAYEKARLEAVAREAEAAILAKNAELDALRAQLEACLASQGGGR